ncbi:MULTISPECIES: hypothetical protein [unclassified Stenotrophomonas]|uniref:hypothetical protein n=1 Tax=unclassified Stenotrophomonas TaxID=196198 RepID=UPI003012A66A
MSAPLDVLQWLGDERFMYGPGTESRAKCEEAHAAVAELIEAADKALAALGAYAEKIDGEWGDCLELEQLLANGEEPEYAALRDAIARVKGGAA